MPDKTSLHPSATSSGFSPIEEIIADIKAGKMVIMVDDENRENEGDLLMAAERVRPEDINYMARYGRGLICLTITRERCAQLRLPLMVAETDQTRISRCPSKQPKASRPESPHMTVPVRSR
jgi:3,4-dihydroxy 2-butanone 4-phosphate synthase/GTP cyclohydrolase II